MPKLYLHFYFHFEVPEVNHFIWPLKVIAWLLLAMYLVSQNISQQRKQCDDGTSPTEMALAQMFSYTDYQTEA